MDKNTREALSMILHELMEIKRDIEEKVEHFEETIDGLCEMLDEDDN